MSPANEFVEGNGKSVGFRLELDPFSLANVTSVHYPTAFRSVCYRVLTPPLEGVPMSITGPQLVSVSWSRLLPFCEARAGSEYLEPTK